MFERTDPQTLKIGLIVAAAIYFIFPFDLLPDFLGLPGRIDDLAIIAWSVWFYRNHLRQFVSEQPRPHSHSTGDSNRQRRPEPPKGSKAFDAYQVLGIPRSASSDAIKAAYRSRMQEYHPDKVAHLGEELQKLAHEKSQEIQRAYRQLSS